MPSQGAPLPRIESLVSASEPAAGRHSFIGERRAPYPVDFPALTSSLERSSVVADYGEIRCFAAQVSTAQF